jgi:hypothetical protein
MSLISASPRILARLLAGALMTLVAVGSLASPPAARAADPLITVTITQAPVSISTLNIEKVAVTAHFVGFVAPYHYVFSVRGVAVNSGDSSVPDLTVNLTNNCSITTQSVSVSIADTSGLAASASGILDHSLCPPPPTGHHASDHILAGPTITKASFIDRLRAVNSPAYSSGTAIYNQLTASGVNPAFALGLFQAESASGTKGYAVTTLNWGNMLYHSWQTAYGAVPYAPGNGYTYARFPSWLAGVQAFAHLVVLYDAAGYVTISQASAHWLGTVEGSARHLKYLKNITAVMTLLPDDAVPKMVGLAGPAHAPGTFAASWSATDNLGVTGYQIRTKRGTGAWSVPTTQTARSKAFTLGSGAWLISVRATDAAANWSGWRTIGVSVDASLPVLKSVSGASIVRSTNGSFVVSFRATDNIGVSRYLIRWKKGLTGAWSPVHGQTGRSKSFTGLTPGTWYVEVSARDAVGNRAPWRLLKIVVPKDDRSFSFSKGTIRSRGSADIHGTTTSTTHTGATMTAKFSGDHFYLIGTTGVSKGKMRITIDGVSVTIDEGRNGAHRATTTHHRVLLYSKSLAAGAHTVVITNLGTAGRPTITIDALGWRT